MYVGRSSGPTTRDGNLPAPREQPDHFLFNSSATHASKLGNTARSRHRIAVRLLTWCERSHPSRILIESSVAQAIRYFAAVFGDFHHDGFLKRDILFGTAVGAGMHVELVGEIFAGRETRVEIE